MSTSGTITKCVILARGLGTRMRRDDGTTTLNAEQSAAAGAGLKAMIPVGRPFLDYLLSALADAGFQHVCLVIGPEHNTVRKHYIELQDHSVSTSVSRYSQSRLELPTPCSPPRNLRVRTNSW